MSLLTMLQDADGNTSSKRVVGFSMIGFAMLLALILFIVCGFLEVKNSATMIEIIDSFLYAGTSLLGIGVLERFAPKEKTKNIS